MRDAAGNWAPDFDPFKSGANHHYVEGNAWQLTFFVPQDVPGLASLIGRERFLERLEWGFGESYKWRFNGPNRSEEHTSELQSLMRISYAVFCLKKKKKTTK